jgi:hypothetical protein
VQVGLDGTQFNFCFSIWLQFQLDRTLLSKSIKHQHKPINLADVNKQTELEIPNLHKALNVTCHFAKSETSTIDNEERKKFVTRKLDGFKI